MSNAPWSIRKLRELPAAQRSVIVLVDLEGESQRSAAQRLGWSEDAVRGRLARAAPPSASA